MSTLNNGLQLLFKLDSINNAIQPHTVWDSSGQALTGTINGSAKLQTDESFGNHLQFDGDSYVAVSNPAPGNVFPYSPTGWSVSLWVKPDAFTRTNNAIGISNILFCQTISGGVSVALGFNYMGQIVYSWRDSKGAHSHVFTETNLVGYNWNFIAVTVLNNSISLKINSVSLTGDLGDGTPPGKAVSFNLGGWPGNPGYLNGGLANFRTYNRQLTNSELVEIMQSDLRNSLEIYAPLNQINNNKTPDVSEHNHVLSVEGGVSLVADARFGTVMEFSGSNQNIICNDFIHSSQSAGSIHGMTIGFWVNFKTSDTHQGLAWAGYGNWSLSLGDYNGIYAHKLVFKTTDRNGNEDILVGKTSLEANQWYYVCVNYAAGSGEKIIYLNGENDASRTVHAGLPLGKSNSKLYWYLGGWSEGGPTYLNGKMAQCHYYTQAISPDWVKRDMGQSMVTSSAFWVVAPLFFSIREDDGSKVLYINDAGSKLSINILNTASTPILFDTAAHSPSTTYFQLALGFRPGTLSEACLANIEVEDKYNWAISEPKNLGMNGVWLYLTALRPMTIAPLATLSLTLTGISADPLGGARVTRVACSYENITYAGRPEYISGNQELTLSVVNHQGEDAVPVHIGFVGSDRVLNDGVSNNTLQLRLTNMLSADLPPAQQMIRVSGGQTRFSVRLTGRNEGEAKDWALNTYNVLKTATLSISTSKGNFEWSSQLPGTENTSVWSFVPQQDFALAPDEYIDFTISDLKVEQPSSISHIFLEIEDLPGYWDNSYMLEVEKQPLSVGNTGIGVGTIPGKYHVALGNATSGIHGATDGTLQFYTGDKARMTLNKSGSLTIGSSSKPGNLVLNGGKLSLQAASAEVNSQLHFLDSSGALKGGIQLGANGTLSLAYARDGALVNALNVNKNGFVGIGTNSENATVPLQISGGTNASPDSPNSGTVIIGNPAGSHLAIDSTQIIAKSSASLPTTLHLGSAGQNTVIQGNLFIGANQSTMIQGDVTLGGNGKTLTAASTLNAPMGIYAHNGIQLNSGKLNLNSNGLSMPAGSFVTGIPIVDFKTQTSTFTGKKGGLKTLSLVFTFDHPVKKAAAFIAGWKLNFDGDDHNIQKMEVSAVEISTLGGNQITVNVAMGLTNSSNWNNAYSGEISVTVVASMNQSINL